MLCRAPESGGIGRILRCLLSRARRSPDRFAKISFGGGFSAGGLRACQVYDTFPQTKEEEEFDLLGVLDGTCEFHGSFAARALEWISAPTSFAKATEGRPGFENEVAPEGAHGTGGLFLGCWDEENLGLEILDFRLRIVDFGFLICRRWTDDAVGDEELLASGFVGIEAALADGFFSFGREE